MKKINMPKKYTILIVLSLSVLLGSRSFADNKSICETQGVKDKITFLNLCLWAPDLNESIILSGEFDLNIIGKQIEIIRSSLGSSTDGWTDKYSLTRQE